MANGPPGNDWDKALLYIEGDISPLALALAKNVFDRLSTSHKRTLADPSLPSNHGSFASFRARANLCAHVIRALLLEYGITFKTSYYGLRVIKSFRAWWANEPADAVPPRRTKETS
jgi:hypothetical protein